MTDENRCPQCGTPLAADGPQGLCPGCLLKRGLEPQTLATEGGEGDRSNLCDDQRYASVPAEGPFRQIGPVPFSDTYPPPTPAELAPLFPELEIIELVGRGGMGVVYKARQKHLDRLVALKILSPTISREPAFAERFAREARALAMLSHPHIVAVYDFGQTRVVGQVANLSHEGGEGGLYYFLMEFVDGVNLRRLLDVGKLSPEEALAIVPQICEALQYAHDAGVVHRDIKPENILLDKRGQVKIADFGIAKLVDRRVASGQWPVAREQGAEEQGQETKTLATRHSPLTTNLTAAGQVMGTPQYMAPEQVEHPQQVDHRADIYSLGVVFYQMLTGELPVGRFAPPSRKVQIDVRLDEVVLRALEKEPDRRYQQASELKTRVETIATTPEQRGAMGSAPFRRPRRPSIYRWRTWWPCLAEALSRLLWHARSPTPRPWVFSVFLPVLVSCNLYFPQCTVASASLVSLVSSG